MFRRRRAAGDEPLGDDELRDDELKDDELKDDELGHDAFEEDGLVDDGLDDEPTARPQGPWDVSDAPDDDLLDLGGLRVPIVEGFDVSITAEQDIPVVVTYGGADGLMQLHAFAAPRSSGIWAEVRTEIADSLAEGGGRAQEANGPFGTELSATIPVEGPDGSHQLQPARFVGIDGPRWFLRALITGPIVDDRSRVRALEDVIRRVVVVRGGDAMAPREVIPLRLPREVMQAAEEAAAAQEGDAEDFEGFDDDTDPGEDAGERPRFTMPERGPEITEVR